MARPVTDPTLRTIQIRLGDADRDALDAIAREVARRTGRVGTRTDAARWAARELRERLRLERSAGHAGKVVLSGPGPMTAPPGAYDHPTKGAPIP